MNLSGMPQAEPTHNVITNDGFYPDLDTAELVKNYAIATEYGGNDQMIIEKLILAIGEINELLNDYKNANWYQAPQLTDVSSAKIGDKSLLESLYKTAVFCNAKSKLLISKLGETHRDQRAAQQLQASDNREHWLIQSDHAIRQMIGVSKKISVSLI